MADNIHQYGAGETQSTEIEIPDFVKECAEQLRTVREALSRLWAELYPRNQRRSWYDSIAKPEPIRKMEIQASINDLEKEEKRLQDEIESYQWLIPSLFDPPHNKIVSAEKAKTILREGQVHGQPLSERQKRFFGFIAGGGKPTRA